MKQFASIGIFFLSLFILGTTLGGAHAEIKCALVCGHDSNLENSAVFNLLQVELSNDSRLAMLERAEIDKIFDEKTLQIAFTDSGTESGRNFGTLLGADLLILLKAGKEEDIEFLDIIIIETSSGLKIYKTRIFWDKDKPENTVKELIDIINKGLKIHSTEVSAVIAVPPFLSDDLIHKYDSLQNAFAELLKQRIQNVPGMRLVELEEARAIADEYKVSGQRDVVRPLLPYYILGKYRNNIIDDVRNINISMEAKLLENVVCSKTIESLSPEYVGDFFQKFLNNLLFQIDKNIKTDSNPEIEVKELKARIDSFCSMNKYEEAVCLIESCILLKPDDLDIRTSAIELYTKLIEKLAFNRIYKSILTEQELISAKNNVEKSLIYNLGALDHFEYLINNKTFLKRYEKSKYTEKYDTLIWDFWLAGLDKRFGYNSKWREFDLMDLVSEVGYRKREIVFSIYRKYSSGNKYTKRIMKTFHERRNVSMGYAGEGPLSSGVYKLIDESEEDELECKLNLIKTIKVEDKNWGYVKGIILHNNKDTQAYKEFLKKVEDLPWRQAKYAVKYAKILIKSQSREEDVEEYLDLLMEIYFNDPDLIDCLYLRQLINSKKAYIAKYKTNKSYLNNQRKIDHIKGPSDIIFSASDYTIYKNKYTVLYEVEDKSQPIRQLLYDGKYLWVVYENKMEIMNLDGEVIDVISGSDGIPEGKMNITKIMPGYFLIRVFSESEWHSILHYECVGKMEFVEAEVDFKPIEGICDKPIKNWIKGPEGIDIFWDFHSRYVEDVHNRLKEVYTKTFYAVTAPGEVKELIKITDREWYQHAVCDGKYLWITAENKLIVINPENGVTDEITEDNGLPSSRDIKMVALEQGYIFLTGSLDGICTWLGTIKYDEDGHKTVDIFYEAREKKGDILNPAVVFQPQSVFTDFNFSSNPSIFVFRKMEDSGKYHPLHIDLIGKNRRSN